MKNAFNKDISRTILKGSKRFLAIIIITILGVTMFSGLRAACEDLRKSADSFFDAQNLHDIYILSTLGLTDEDVAALSELDEVSAAEGIYTETVSAVFPDNSINISMRTLSTKGIDEPYVIEGRLPSSANEAAVTSEFLSESGLSLGDTFTIEETLDEGDENTDPEETNFKNTEFTISGVVIDVTSIDNPEGSSAYRSSGNTEMSVFILPEAVDSDVYTAICLTLKTTEGMFCYSDSYTAAVDAFKGKLENEIIDQREEARYNEIKSEAESELSDAEEEVEQELTDAYQELKDGEKELEESLADAKAKLDDAYKELTDGEKELEESLADAKAQLDDAAASLNSAQAQLDDGLSRIESAEAELAAQEATANASFSEAWAKINSNRQTLDTSLSQWQEGSKQLADGEAQLNTAKAELTEKEAAAYQELNSKEAELNENLATVKSGEEAVSSQKSLISAAAGELWPEAEWSALVNASVSGSYETEYASMLSALYQLPEEIQSALLDESGSLDYIAQMAVQLGMLQANETQLSAGLEQLAASRAQAEAQFSAARSEISAQEVQLSEKKAELASAYSQIEAGYSQLDAGEAELKAQEASAYQQIESAKKTIEDNRQSLEAAKIEIADGWAEYNDGLKEYEQGKSEGEQELTDGWAEYEDGLKEYEDGKAEGEQELADGWAEYEDGRSEAEEELADARKKIADIKMATWYVQDRSSLNGYINISNDAASIETLGTVFPFVFLIVAILISLTTISRMVDEERGSIGTYMALGFTHAQTSCKYLIFSLTAGAIGSIFGTVFAFVVLPSVIAHIFRTMYLLPDYLLVFDPIMGIFGPIIFIGSVLLSALYSCRRKLAKTPATLMRPKAPKSGTRIFIERIGFFWKRLSFLSKVTARNLFRYKKRLVMTIFGISGCTALLLFGFSIKDSVSDLMPGQYEDIFYYDMMAVASSSDDNDTLLSYINDDAKASSYINCEITSVNISHEDSEELSVTLIAVPDDSDFSSYIHLSDLNGNPISLKDGEVYVTRNAHSVLGFDKGDSISVQLPDLTTADIEVSDITENYLGNYIYMTETTYENYFGDYEANAALINLKDGEDVLSYSEALGKQDGILSCTSTKELSDDFSDAFELINMVVYVIIFMSGALALVVLFTLQSTNISERERELATTKVLGFYDSEVHQYVNRETYIMTAFGIIIGMPLGYGFAQMLSQLLKLPSVYLPSSLHPISYLYAILLNIAFMIVVNLITNRSLNAINPATALKSIE